MELATDEALKMNFKNIVSLASFQRKVKNENPELNDTALKSILTKISL